MVPEAPAGQAASGPAVVNPGGGPPQTNVPSQIRLYTEARPGHYWVLVQIKAKANATWLPLAYMLWALALGSGSRSPGWAGTGLRTGSLGQVPSLYKSPMSTVQMLPPSSCTVSP